MTNELRTPHDIRQRIWAELGRASKDRHHAWRYPVLATVGSDGAANARTVVLRSVDVARQMLFIHTDARSPKATELGEKPHALFVFWSARLKWQLRVRVAVVIDTDGPKVEALWQQVKQSAAAADYLGRTAPGSPCPDAHIGAAAADGRSHFALISASVLEMDWLELGRSGHRRARVLADTWQWLTP
jgi:general stress protein 26